MKNASSSVCFAGDARVKADHRCRRGMQHVRRVGMFADNPATLQCDKRDSRRGHRSSRNVSSETFQ